MRTGNRRWERQEMTRVSTPLAVAAEHYLMACLTEGKTPKTLRGYREKLSRFIRWLEGSVDELTVTMAREFVAALQAKKKWQDVPSVRQSGQRLSAQTVANHVRVMKAFSTWLYEEGFTVENVLARLALPKVPRKVIDILSQEEIARLVAAIDATSEMAARDRAVIVLFLDTGLRLSELVSLSR